MKVLIVLLSCMIINSLSYAQSFSVGTNAGLNYSNIYGSFSAINTYKPGFSAEIYTEVYVTKMLGLSTGIAYEQKGFQYKNGSLLLDNYIKAEQSLDYLSIPILFKYRFGKIIKLSLSLGTYMGILIKARDKGSRKISSSPDTFEKWDTNIYFDTENVDFGLHFGAGIQYPLNQKYSLAFDLGYNHGLSIVNPATIYVEEYRNVSANIKIGIVYYLLNR